MSRKKIKRPNEKKEKVFPSKPLTMLTAAASHLNVTRAERYNQDSLTLHELIDDGTLLPEDFFNKKKLEEIAKTLKWKVGYLEKLITKRLERIRMIESALKQSEEKKNKEKTDV